MLCRSHGVVRLAARPERRLVDSARKLDDRPTNLDPSIPAPLIPPPRPQPALLSDRDDVPFGSVEEIAFGDGGRGHADLVHLVLGEQFVLRAGLDDEDVALFGSEIDLSVARHG